MKLIFGLSFFWLVISLPIVAQNYSIEDHFFDNLGAVFFTDQGLPVLAQDGKDHKGIVLEPETGYQKKLIREGKGPGEISKVYGYGFDRINNELCLIGIGLRLVCSDLNGNTTKDMRIPWFKVSGVSSPFRFYIEEQELLLPIRSLLSVEEPDNELKVAAISQKSDLEKVEFLSLQFEDLGLDYLDELSLANNIFIKPKVLRLSANVIMVAIPGLPYFYFFKNGEYRSKELITTDYEVRIEVSIKPEYPSPGVLTPANLNNLQRLDDNHFIVARGNSFQKTPLGIDLYRFDLKGPSVKVEQVDQMNIENLPEGFSEPNVTIHDEKAYIITNYIYFAMEISVLEVGGLLNRIME